MNTMNLNDEEQTLGNFFEIMNKTCKMYKEASIRSLFVPPSQLSLNKEATNKINVELFLKGLSKLGYNETTQKEIDFLCSRYMNKFVRNLINLDFLENEYTDYVPTLETSAKQTTPPKIEVNAKTIEESNMRSNFLVPNTSQMNSGFNVQNNKTKEIDEIPEVQMMTTQYVPAGTKNPEDTQVSSWRNNPSEKNMMSPEASFRTPIPETNSNVSYQGRGMVYDPNQADGRISGLSSKDSENLPSFGANNNMNVSSPFNVNSNPSYQVGSFNNHYNTTGNIYHNTNNNNTPGNNLYKNDSSSYKMNTPNNFTNSNNSNMNSYNINNVPQRSEIFTNNLNSENNFYSVNPMHKEFEAVDKRMLDELKENHNYIRANLYQNFNNYYKRYSGELQAMFQRLDKFSTGFVQENNFEDTLDECILVSQDEKKILMMDILRNSIGDYSYKDFLEKIKNFNNEEITNQIKNYHAHYNDYIVKIRRYIKERQVDVRKSWASLLGGSVKTDINGYDRLLSSIGLSLSKEETEYTFSKIASQDGIISFKQFENIFTREPPSRESLNKTMNETKPAVINTSSNVENALISSPVRKSMREAKLFEELKNKSEPMQVQIVYERMLAVEKKVEGILTKCQNYSLLNTYNQLADKLPMMGTMPQTLFAQRDRERNFKVSESDFGLVLHEMQIPLSHDQINLVLQNLNSKTQTHYSYEEFLRRVYTYYQQEHMNKKSIERRAHCLYNDYLLEFKTYLTDKKIDIALKWEQAFGKALAVGQDQFYTLLLAVGFNLSHVNEYKYMFSKLSENGSSLSLKGLLDFLSTKEITEEEFIENGVINRDMKSSNGWKVKLSNYTQSTSELYKSNYNHLFNIFREINNSCKKNNVPDLVAHFEKNTEINQDGEINDLVFANIIGKLGVSKSLNFQALINTFLNQKTKLFNLAQFFNIYYAFYPEDKVDKSTKPDQKTLDVTTNQHKEGKIVYKNHIREFTEENMAYIKELINYFADIILDELNINIVDFFKLKDSDSKGHFTVEELNLIIRDDLLVETEGQEDNFKIFYDFLLDDLSKKEIIQIARLIEAFEQYSQNGIIVKQEKTQIPDASYVTKENQILREFSCYLDNNRIKFTSVFPSLIKNPNLKSIQLYELKQGFQNVNYPISNGDLEFLVTFFDPYQKMNISLDALRSQIVKYAPEYFNKPFQKINQEQVRKESSLHSKINTNPKIITCLQKINKYIQDKRITVQEFFELFHKKPGEQINKSEFLSVMTSLSPEFQLNEMQDIFSFLDKDNSNSIKINELHLYLNNANLTNEEKKGKAYISNKMLEEIHEIFKYFDVDKDDKISKEDFFKAMKSMDHRTTLQDVELIMKKVDKDKNEYIERSEFVELMVDHLKEEMVLRAEEREYIVKMFKEEDVDKVGFLSIAQLKHLFREKLNSDLSETELNELINEADCNYDGMIDIDEFLKILDKTEDNENLNNTVRQINMKRKINPKTFLSIFNGLPMNFIPSFIRDEQRFLKLLPSDTLRPQVDQTGILYKDILPLTSLKSSTFNLDTTKILMPIPTKVNAKISFQMATGVAIPDESTLNRDQNIVGRVLHIAMFDSVRNKFIGNSISIEASWKKEYEDRWYFEEDRNKFNNNVIIRYNEDDMDNISVIFEFVLMIKKESNVVATSCGWSSCDLKDLLKPNQMKLPIKGGSPKKSDVIQPFDIRTKRTGWGKFKSIFSGQVKSQLPIKIKPFKELSNNDKQNIDYLPTCIVAHRAGIQMISVYRKFIAKQILNHQFYSLKVIKSQHPILNCFCKIADCPDAYRPMIELWNELVIEGATNDEKKDEAYWENNLIDFVNRVYTVLYAEKFNYDDLDPAKTAIGYLDLLVARTSLVNSAIRHDKVKKGSK